MTTTPTKTEAPTSPEVSSGGESESFGTWLRRERELREITLREIADTSKISLRYLQALEQDRFDILPAAVFAKGFLRQYARYVGLDPEETVNFYLAAHGAAAADEADDDELAPRQPRPVTNWSYALVVLLAAIVLLAVAWALLRLNQNAAEGTEEVPPASAGPPAVPSTNAAVASPEPSRAASHAGEHADRAPNASPPPEAAASTAANTVGNAATSTAPAVQAGSALAAPLAVTLDFRGDCWVRALADGTVKADKVYTQGESLQLSADRDVELEIGNIFEVDVEVNGRLMELDDGSQNPVRRLRIDLATAADLLQGDKDESGNAT